MRATHVEIWSRPERKREFELMARVRPDALTAWNRYLSPEIDADDDR